MHIFTGFQEPFVTLLVILFQYNHNFRISLASQILFRFSTVLPDSANLIAGILVRAFTTSLVALGGYTFMHLAQMAAEVELWALLNHLVHCHFLQKLTVHVAVLTVVEARATVSVCAAVLDTGQRHAAALTELGQLSLLKCFLFFGESGFVSLESFRIFVGNEIALGRTVSGLIWDKIGICPILIEHVMLRTSWPVNIPECLACKVLDLTIIFGLF